MLRGIFVPGFIDNRILPVNDFQFFDFIQKFDDLDNSSASTFSFLFTTLDEDMGIWKLGVPVIGTLGMHVLLEAAAMKM